MFNRMHSNGVRSKINSSSARLGISALLGMAVAGAIFASPASAQGMMKDDDMALRMDPAPISYPFAAPGNIDKWHWSSYNRMDLEPGSAQWAREDRRDRRNKAVFDRLEADRNSDTGVMFHRGEMSEDWLAPAPIGYPFAAPGSIDMWHWRSYHRMDLEPGSIANTAWDRMDHRNMAVRERMKAEDAKMMHDGPVMYHEWDPMPMSYPFAAPGSIDKWHWRSYNKMDLEPGSVQSAREDHMMKRMKDHKGDDNSNY